MDIGDAPHGMQTGSLKPDRQIEHWIMVTTERALDLPLHPTLPTVGGRRESPPINQHVTVAFSVLHCANVGLDFS